MKNTRKSFSSLSTYFLLMMMMRVWRARITILATTAEERCFSRSSWKHINHNSKSPRQKKVSVKGEFLVIDRCSFGYLLDLRPVVGYDWYRSLDAKGMPSLFVWNSRWKRDSGQLGSYLGTKGIYIYRTCFIYLFSHNSHVWDSLLLRHRRPGFWSII